MDKQERNKKKIRLIIIIAIITIIGLYLGLEFLALKQFGPRIREGQMLSAYFNFLFKNPLGCMSLEKDTYVLVGVGVFLVFGFFFLGYRPHKKIEAQATGKLMTKSDIKRYTRNFVLNPLYGPHEKTVDYKYNENDKNEGSHGKKVFKDEPKPPVKEECLRQACIISESLSISFDNIWCRKNTNALIIGTAGSGKSRYYVGPNILQANTNYIVTDPSGDLYSQYAKYLENEGYEVKKLDLVDMYDSERYNPLFYINEEKDVFTLVNMLTENIAGASKEEPIWKNSKEALLRATILYLWMFEADKSKKNFSNVLRLINSAKINDDDEDDYTNQFDEIFERIKQIDPLCAAATQYDIFRSAGEGKTRDSILITTTSQMSLFGLSNIAYLTSDDEMDLRTFADKKCALFLIIPTEDNTYNFIASLLYSQLFLMLYEYAEKRTKYSQHIYIEYVENGVYHNENIKIFQANNEEDMNENAVKKAETLLAKIKKGLKVEYDDFKDLYYIKTEDGEVVAWRGTQERAEKLKKLIEKHAKIRQGDEMRLPEHCHFILDEFANTGKIPTFCEKLSTIRKYRMNCSIIVQSPDQLKNMYEKEWNVIVDNTNVKICLGTNSYDTAKWVSDQLGEKEIYTRSESIQSNNISGSSSISTQKKAVLAPNEILELQENEGVFMIYGGFNIKEPMYEIENHPKYQEAKKYKGKYKTRRKAVKKAKTDYSKEFSETLTSSAQPAIDRNHEKEALKEQKFNEGLMTSNDMADAFDSLAKEEFKKRETERKEFNRQIKMAHSKVDVNSKVKKVFDGRNGGSIESKELKQKIENKTPIEMREELEASSCVTDMSFEEFIFESGGDF